jgi:hypothetical protein
MGPFPPGTGGGAGVAYGRKGQGILLHRLTDAAGRPWSTRTTPATGNERAPVLPLLEALHIRTGNRGRPRQRRQVLATETGYAANDLRQRLRPRGSRAQIPQRVWKTSKSRGRPINNRVPRIQAERTCAWFQRKDRRLVVRWERLAACFKASLAIAVIQRWVHR